MENQINSWLKEIYNQIPHFFVDEIIKKHLDAFVTWNDFEWFNIALILYQRPDATFVNSLDSWNAILQKNFYVKKGEKGIKIVIPTLNGDRFKWQQSIVWDIEQCHDHHMIGNVSELRECMEILFESEIIEGIQDKKEVMDYIKKATSSLIVQSIADDNAIVYYIYECIGYVLSNYLPINYEEKNLDFQKNNLSNEQYVNIYISLKNIINQLTQTITAFYIQKNAHEKKNKELEWAKKMNRMNIKQRVEEARLFLLRENSKKGKEEENYDFDDPVSQRSVNYRL